MHQDVHYSKSAAKVQKNIEIHKYMHTFIVK